MSDPWKPDEEFLEFLQALQDGVGVELLIGGKLIIDEMRAGTALGRDLYEKMRADAEFKDAFEEWKYMK